MKTKNACILLLAALTMTACEYDDSALWEQVNQNTERIAALEAWQAETNTNIQSLQTLLNTTDHITDVTPVMENEVEVGYTISFLNSDPITIYCGDNGTAGSTPKIGVTQEDDGNWYWTLNGELLTDADGNSIRANGDSAPVPQLKTGTSLTVSEDSDGAAIVDDAFYLSMDEGKTWTRVSGTDGDSFFSDVKVTDEAVIFTLKNSDGTITSFSVPRYTGIKLTFETPAVHLGYGGTLPVNFTAEGSDQFTTDNLFIIAPDGWKAEVTLPTRAATEFILTVTAPADANSGAAEGEILVMLDNGQGSTTIGRLKVAVTIIDINGTTLTARNLEAGKLAEAIGDRSDLTSVTVTSGTLDETDWAAIKKSIDKLEIIDLEGATYEGDDKDNWVYRIDYSAMDGKLETVKLPQGITALGEIAFYGCLALTTVTLPETLTSIGNRAFNSCYALTSIGLPDKVTSIGSYAFTGCKVLTSIDLPDGLTSIENYTFYNCTALKSITLPKELTTIGNDAFRNCTSLTSIDLPDKVTTIGGYAFNSCSALESIDLPDGLKSIGNYAFMDCEALTSITLPEGVTSIGNGTFANCTSLTSIDLPDGVTTIGYSAFYNCSALESIDLPDGVTTIGDSAFQNCCTSLTTVTCQATGVPNLGVDAFKDCSKLANIYVPAGSVDDYKAATGWSEYENIIQAIP